MKEKDCKVQIPSQRTKSTENNKRLTLILSAWERTLTHSEDPENKVEHTKGEGHDSIADKLTGQKKTQGNSFE